MANWQDHDIDDLFRDSLGSGQRIPPPPVWENIEAELDKDKRRRLILWWIPASVAVFLTIVATGVWLTQNSKRPVSVHLASRTLSHRAVTRKPMPGSRPTPAGTASVKTSLQPASIDQQPVFVALQHAGTNRPAINSLSLALSPVISTPPSPITPTTLKVVARIRPAPTSLLHLDPPRHRFDLTGYVSQELAGYNFADHDSAGPRGREIEKQQNTSFSRSVGLVIAYHLHHRWLVESGVSISRSITVSNPGKTVAVVDNNGKIAFLVNTVTGFGYVASNGNANIGDSANAGKTTGKVDYISLPLIVSRKWTAGRFTLLAGAGVDINLLTRATIQTSITNASGVAPQTEITQNGLRRINYGWQIKGECRYRLSQNYAATVMTAFKSSVSSVNINTPYSTYPYNLGIGIGITRTF
jgi:hypothetical protein